MIDASTLPRLLIVGALLWSGPAIAESPDSASVPPTGSASTPPADSSTPARPKVLTLERLVLPDELENPEPVRVKFEKILTEQLRSAGFEVLPSHQFEVLRTAVTDSMGGYFDTETGEIDSTRFEAVRVAVQQAARSQLGADAIVRAGIVRLPVEFRGGPKVRWEGAVDNIGASGYGTVPAYTFLVFVKWPDGREVHAGAGGIQLAKKFKKKSLLDSGLIPKEVERKDLFTKEDKNVHAVRMALTPFAANEKEKD